MSLSDVKNFPANLKQCIMQHSIFPMLVAGATYSSLAVTSSFCLYWYFTQVASNDFWHWQLVSYVIMFANAIAGYSEFFSGQSFCPLRELLDYCQIVMVLPCYAAQMWIKNEMGPPEISCVFVGLGITAALMYIMYECRRQDLTDLAVFANAFSLMAISAYSLNPLITLATFGLVWGYSVYKRAEYQCCLAPQDKFNLVMAAFALVALGSFDDDLIERLFAQVKAAAS